MTIKLPYLIVFSFLPSLKVLSFALLFAAAELAHLFKVRHFMTEYLFYCTAEKLTNTETGMSNVIAALKAETQLLSEDIQSTRRTSLRQINDLTVELDDLKKLRLSMEVEVERMKKLLV